MTPEEQDCYDALREDNDCLKQENDALAARLADTEAQLERNSARLTEAERQNADLMAIIDKRDEALGFIPLDKGMDMQDELRETKARLAEAERDAERYRRLRDNPGVVVGPSYVLRRTDELDAAIDAAKEGWK